MNDVNVLYLYKDVTALPDQDCSIRSVSFLL